MGRRRSHVEVRGVDCASRSRTNADALESSDCISVLGNCLLVRHDAPDHGYEPLGRLR